MNAARAALALAAACALVPVLGAGPADAVPRHAPVRVASPAPVAVAGAEAAPGVVVMTADALPEATGARRILDAAALHLGADSSLVLAPSQVSADVACCSEFASLIATEAGLVELFTPGVPGSAVNTSTNRWWTWAAARALLVWGDPPSRRTAPRPTRCWRRRCSPSPVVSS